MNDADHRMVPAGTVTDKDSGNTVSVHRDYDTGMILGTRLDEAGLIALRAAIDGILDGIRAYRRELAADAADELDEAPAETAVGVPVDVRAEIDAAKAEISALADARAIVMAARDRMAVPAEARAACECILSCAEDPRAACSLSGEWHVHPGEPCPVHPDAPGGTMSAGGELPADGGRF